MGTEVIPNAEEAASAEAPSSVESQIIRQIEYYFGDYNLSRDKFLREQLKLDDGWVPLETMIKFNRLKKLSEDFDVIIGALKKSPKQMMEVSEDCKKIRRKNVEQLPEEISKRFDELDPRTLYVKGFKRNNTLDELLDFFKDHNVQHVHMRKRPLQNDKVFKGSCFVTFESKEDATKFLETKGIKYNGTELLKEWKVDYMKRKDEEFKRIKEEKQKKLLEKGKTKETKKEQENGEKKVKEIEMVPGCLLKLTNLDEKTTREDIQSVFEPLGDLVYTDYSRGKPEAVLRFESPVAKSIFEKVTKEGDKVKIGSCEANISLIEGEDEKKYWEGIAVSRAQSRQRFNKGHGHRGKRVWGRQKRKNDNENEKDDESAEPPQKKVKEQTSEEKSEKESASMEVSSETAKVDTNSKSES